MKDIVVIKSYQNGITLHINDQVPFEDIIREISCKFTEARSFFGKSKMALSIKGRELSAQEEQEIVETIQQNCNVSIFCIVGNDNEMEQVFLNALETAQKAARSAEEELGQFYKGTLKNGQTLETENSIVILGDVLEGCSVVSSKNIIILGSLLGKAYAGVNGNRSHFIVALDLSPESLRIGDYKWKAPGKKRWGVKPKAQPKIAYIEDEKIITEPLTKDLLEEI